MDIQEYVKEIEHLLYAAQDPTKRWVDGHHAVIELIAERDALRELLNDRTNDVEHEYARAEAAEARIAELKAWSAAWQHVAKDYRFRAGRYYSSDVRHCKDLKRLKAERDEQRARIVVLELTVNTAIKWLDKMSSADGSGHGDLAERLREMSGIASSTK